MVYKLEDTMKVEELFQDWQETPLWSCLQNIMGSIYVEDLENPLSAMVIIGDLCFFAGLPTEELVLYKPKELNQNFIIMVPQNEEWAELIAKGYGDRARKVSRYAIKKEPNVFDKEKLQEAVSTLPAGYSLRMIDEEVYDLCKANEWSRDLVSQYKDYPMYQKLGIGVVVFENETIVAGASSYTRYQDGIEIEIDTREDYRRKGLAYVCGAKLILECLERNLYPSWDAHNLWSVALSEKLGYHFDHEYTAFEIWGY